MGLKVRVKHPLGEKSLVLPPRAAGKPVTVGRSSSADVQVPSIHIAPVQCIMFVHGGKWVVQDAGGESSGTMVNGHAIAQPTVLKIGDVVTLGLEVNAPSVKVEGVGAGAPGASPAPAQRKAGAASASASTPADAGGQSGAFDDDVVTDDGLGAAAASYQSKKFYVPKGPRMSPTALTAGIMIALALVVVIVVLAYKFNQQSSQAAAPTPKVVTVTPSPPAPAATTPPPQPAPVRPRAAQQPPAQVRENAAPAELPPPGVETSLPDQPRKPFANANNGNTEDGAKTEKASTAGSEATAAAPDDPKKKDTEWQRVEEAYKFLAPQAALLVFEDYRGAYPNSPYGKEIAKYTEETLDLLWWHRIKALCDARDITQEEIKKLDRDIAIENNKDYRAKLIKQRADVQERKKQTQELIVNEFAFKEKDPPDLYNANTLGALRGKRDKSLWENFKKSVMESIRRERKVPWE